MRKSILILLLAGLVYGGGFELSGVGTRGLSMGDAFRALANDWTALYWNPAGMSYVGSDIIGFHNAIIKPWSYFKPNTGILGYDGPYSTVTEVRTQPQTFTIPSGGFVKNFKYLKNTKIGLAVFVPFGLGTSWKLYHLPIGYYNPSDTATFTPPNFPKYNWQSDVRTASMLVGLSKKFKKFSIGIGVGPTFERLTIRKINFFDPATVDTHALSLPIQYRLFPIDTKLEVKGWAASASVGAIYEISKNFRAGISGRFYSPATLTGDANLWLYFPYNDAIASRADSLAPFFLGGVASGYGTAEVKVTLPFNIGAGLAYNVTKKFMITADVSYTHWASFSELIAKFTNLKIKMGDVTLSEIKEDTLKEYWNSTVKFGIGMRYRVNDKLTVRSGAYYDGTPIPDSTITPLIPDANPKVGVTLGVEYSIFDFLQIQFNAEYVHSSPKTVERSENYSYKSSYLAGEYGFGVNTLGLGVEYKF